jgi:hypothetical protein
MKLLDESYFKAKLFAIAILVHDKEERTNEGVAILRQIARDARAEQAGKDREAVSSLPIDGEAGLQRPLISRDSAIAALDKAAKGE